MADMVFETCGGLKRKKLRTGEFKKSYYGQNYQDLAEVWISTPQRFGSGAYSL